MGLRHPVRQVDRVVHHEKGSQSTQTRVRRRDDGGEEVGRAVSTDLLGRTHRPSEDERLGSTPQQVEQVGRLLDRVGAVRQDDPDGTGRHLIVSPGESVQHVLEGHRGRPDVAHGVRPDLRDSPKPSDCLDELVRSEGR